MPIGRFIKRLISPESDSGDVAPGASSEPSEGSGAPDSGATTGDSGSFIQIDSEVIAAAARETGAEIPGEVVVAAQEVPEVPEVPEAPPEQIPYIKPGPELEPEHETKPVADRLFATDAELLAAGIDPADLSDGGQDDSDNDAEEIADVEPPESPEAAAAAGDLESHTDSEPEPDPEPSVEPEPPADSELELAPEPDPDPISEAVVADESEDNQPEPEPEPEPAAPVVAPQPTPANIDELSLARSAVSTGFVITLATELRTPISSLRVSFDLLKDPEAIRNNPAESRRLVDNIERSIARLERQASDLLEVGYIHSGTLTLSTEPMHASEPVLAAMDISRSTAALRQVAIELEMQPDLPRAIIDGLRVTQIMTHLLSNAIKFTPVGESVVISLETGHSGAEDGDPDLLVIKVIDHGPGIREAHFERIFEPFYRISGEGIEGGAGVGLGLAIVKGLVELHSGEVWVKSTPREVTEFGFSIPLS